MPIIGLNLKSIKASIDEKKIPSGEININSSPIIVNVEKRDVIVPKISDVVGIDFKFETAYEPKIAEINFEGEVLYQTDKVKDVVGKWKKEKKLEDKMAIEILNAIFRKCLSKSVDIANELRLPPPIRFPVVRPKEMSEYIG